MHADKDGRDRILIIEDDRLSLKLYSDLILSRGYELLTAADGATGLDLARKHQPDLVLSDVSLPELSGIEICAALKSDERTRDIPVLILTAWPESEPAALAAGCDGFLVKPVPVSTLWHFVQALIGRHTTPQRGRSN